MLPLFSGVWLSIAIPLLGLPWEPALAWSTALAAALLVPVSLLVHELAHALVARWNGVSVGEIRWSFFHAGSNVRHTCTSPRAQALLSVAGPGSNLVLGVVLLLFSALLASPLNPFASGALQQARLSPLTALTVWFAVVNLMIGVLNLLPAFPMDGGYLLFSILRARTGDVCRATGWTLRVGQHLAWVLVLIGILTILDVQAVLPEVAWAWGAGLVVVGWFLDQTSLRVYRALVFDSSRSVPSMRRLGGALPTVPPNIPLRRLVEEYCLRSAESAFPVIDHDRLVGLVSLQEVSRVPRDRWDTTEVGEIMTSPSHLAIVEPS